MSSTNIKIIDYLTPLVNLFPQRGEADSSFHVFIPHPELIYFFAPLLLCGKEKLVIIPHLPNLLVA
ncbi:MAG: hypothetical protein ACK48B_17460, partial [Dolichospermum sp.]